MMARERGIGGCSPALATEHEAHFAGDRQPANANREPSASLRTVRSRCSAPEPRGRSANSTKSTGLAMSAGRVVGGALAALMVALCAPGAASESTSGGAPVRLSIVAIGDVNFNRDRADVHPDGADLRDRRVPFEEVLEQISPLLNGDIVFANLESVVTDRNDIEPARSWKPFCFRSHPNAVRALIGAGVNLLSLANNHSFDYGATGIGETLRWMRQLASESSVSFAGIGLTGAEAARPGILAVRGVKVGLTALTIGHFARGHSAGAAGLGHAGPALRELQYADVHVRILSIHAGENRTLVPDKWQHRWARAAIRDFGVDVVLMHHPHRVQGIERYGSGLIFYGLGNGAMLGARDLGADPQNAPRHDFGLLARISLLVDPTVGSVSFSRIEVTPLYDMHARPRQLEPREAARRIQVLNDVSRYQVIDERCAGSCLPRDREESLTFTPIGSLGVCDLSRASEIESANMPAPPSPTAPSDDDGAEGTR